MTHGRAFGQGSTVRRIFRFRINCVCFALWWTLYRLLRVPDSSISCHLDFGVLAILVSVLFGLLAIAKPMRPTSGSVICICSYVVAAFLWVWSVLIVGQTWGMGTLFFVNLFIGVGTVVTAFAASLLTAQWGVLGQLVAIALISLGLRVAGVALASK